jgi:hypothetical protein
MTFAPPAANAAEAVSAHSAVWTIVFFMGAFPCG